MVHALGQKVAERTAPPGFGEVAALWQKVTGEDISCGNAIWIDSFDNSIGQADSYRLGRVILAGDAAHWHMPIGGQALNVGLQDAVNLGWKLAGSVNGWAPPHVLDSYHAERHLVAARVLDHVAAQEIILLGGGEMEPIRAVLSDLIGLDQVSDHLAQVASGLDDRYGSRGPTPAGRRIANVRLRSASGAVTTAGLLAGMEPVVVRLAPPAGNGGKAQDFSGGFPIRTIHAIPEGDPFPGITTILMRPDGYVAWAGDDLRDLHLTIGQLYHAPSPCPSALSKQR
jgi:hypothetical protein